MMPDNIFYLAALTTMPQVTLNRAGSLAIQLCKTRG